MEKVLSQIELNDIMGIGFRYKRRLNLLGIFTFKELAEYPMYLLKAEFGNVASHNLKALSMGLDDAPVVSYLEEIETKSVGRNYCLPKNTYDREQNLKTLYELCEEIAIKLRRLKMKARTVGLFLNGSESYGERKTIMNYTSSSKDISEVCFKFFKKWNLEYIRQVSIWVTNLIDEDYITLPLFEEAKKDVVQKVIDQINDRFGHHTIRNGYLTDAPRLHTKPNGFMADRWQRKELAGL
jgi:nucleotidyltransferase/DNA polymerase involved in DNA repair